MEIGLEVSDVSGQKLERISSLDTDASIGQLVEGLLDRMRLPKTDVSGRPLTYHARLEREGRHLHASEKAADALQAGDRLVLQPNIDAGAA
jgi:hypothetical protein